ncbi:MAG: hypothetical protein ACREJC_19085, partial [Tepidisphaeraceae bacterium]
MPRPTTARRNLVFSKRNDPVVSDRAPVSGRWSRRRRTLIVLGLGVLLALPVGRFALARLHADSSTSNNSWLDALEQDMPNADRLRLGIDQYRRGLYEEAVATLQRVKPESLSPSDQKQLSDTLARAQAAASERKAARAEFEKGEEALAANRPGEAMGHYRSAAENKYADEGTRGKAREQMVLAETAIKRANEDLKSVYASAVDDYKAGRLTEAKDKFELLVASGYRAGLFQKSPGDYLNDVNSRLAQMPPPSPPPAQQTPPSEPPPAPPPEVAQQPAPQDQPAPAPQT